MKITFINPPIQDFYTTTVRRQPLGVLYIIAALKTCNHEIDFINAHSSKKKIIPVPDCFSYLKAYFNATSPELRFPFKNFVHFGKSFNVIEEEIKKSMSNAFIISSLFTTYHRETETIIEMVRKHHKNAIIITGGHHASLHSKYILENCDVDYIISGEGEISCPSLVTALEKGIDLTNVPGLIWKQDGIIKSNQRCYFDTIDDFPFPDRDYLQRRDFKFYSKKCVSIISSRGCPNNCKFCTSKTMWGKTHRLRTPENIVQEMKACIEKYNTTIFNFEDDNIFPTKDRAVQLLNAIIQLKTKNCCDLELAAMNGISLEAIDEEIILLMKKAGFKELNAALVSSSDLTLKDENRPFGKAHFERIIQFSKKQGLNVRTYYILGLPGQTKNEINETIEFLADNKVSFFPSIYYNVKSHPKEWRCQRSSAFFNETENLSRQDLIYLFNKSHSMLFEQQQRS